MAWLTDAKGREIWCCQKCFSERPRPVFVKGGGMCPVKDCWNVEELAPDATEKMPHGSRDAKTSRSSVADAGTFGRKIRNAPRAAPPTSKKLKVKT